MHFTVGGRALELTAEQVEKAMLGRAPEPPREHVVDVADVAFPPKQVLAVVTGWDRQSFTTMEAQRVLTRLGFSCSRAGGQPPRTPAAASRTTGDDDLPARVAELEAEVGTLQAAVAGFQARIAALEAR